jgi:serine protease Do
MFAPSATPIRPCYSLVLVGLLLSALVLSGCGAGAESTPEPAAPTTVADPAPTVAAEPDPTTAPEPTPTEAAAAGSISSLEDVQQAVVQIVAEGTFVDPEFGLQLNAAGSGSGFIIDPEGIAVTNNHVVTGAALIRVFVGGNSEPLNARVLGVSECSDLAVIDIEGDGFPFLEWYDQDVNVGLDVFAAGFPLGDPEFTLTRGIISKARTSGESSWASVNEVLEHDATINPGNSGGPLVTADGKVVGINYAGSSATNQYFAIQSAEALAIIERMRGGEDVTSIGVNGEAVAGDGFSGIWVASVKSGSPADNARIQSGDIITSLEGLILATDGTMSDYCDILRSRRADDVMAVEVLRFNTQEQLAGQLNGRELEVAFSFADSIGGGTEDTGDAGAGYSDYRTVTDDTGTLEVQIPVEWGENRGLTWEFDGQDVGVSIAAAPSLDGFYETWETPGVFFGASRSLAANMNEDMLLDSVSFASECTYEGRQAYEDSLYAGSYDLWTNCGGTTTQFVVISVVPENRAFLGLVQIQIVNEADLDALDRIIKTFQVVGDLP